MARHAPALKEMSPAEARRKRVTVAALAGVVVALMLLAVVAALGKKTGDVLTPSTPPSSVARMTTPPTAGDLEIPSIGVTTPPTPFGPNGPKVVTETSFRVRTVTPALTTPPPPPRAAPSTVTETSTRTVTETVTETATATVTVTQTVTLPPPVIEEIVP